MRIPSLPGASEPTFRTRTERWMGLDALVVEVCARLATRACEISPYAAKATIQTARNLLAESEDIPEAELVEQVTSILLRKRVLLGHEHVRGVLVTYGRVLLELDIMEVCELYG